MDQFLAAIVGNKNNRTIWFRYAAAGEEFQTERVFRQMHLSILHSKLVSLSEDEYSSYFDEISSGYSNFLTTSKDLTDLWLAVKNSNEYILSEDHCVATEIRISDRPSTTIISTQTNHTIVVDTYTISFLRQLALIDLSRLATKEKHDNVVCLFLHFLTHLLDEPELIYFPRPKLEPLLQDHGVTTRWLRRVKIFESFILSHEVAHVRIQMHMTDELNITRELLQRWNFPNTYDESVDEHELVELSADRLALEWVYNFAEINAISRIEFCNDIFLLHRYLYSLSDAWVPNDSDFPHLRSRFLRHLLRPIYIEENPALLIDTLDHLEACVEPASHNTRNQLFSPNGYVRKTLDRHRTAP